VWHLILPVPAGGRRAELSKDVIKTLFLGPARSQPLMFQVLRAIQPAFCNVLNELIFCFSLFISYAYFRDT
jgi:hypothetical protein